MSYNARQVAIAAVAVHQHDELPGGPQTMPLADLNKLLANTPFGACGNEKGLGSAVAAAYRFAQKHLGQDVADKIAHTFVGADGKPPWEKY